MEGDAMEFERAQSVGGDPGTEPISGSLAPAGLADPAGRTDWRGDVALELWVEGDTVPVRIRIAGRLDATTAANLHEVVSELLADGVDQIELCTDGLRLVDATAIGSLADIERRVRLEGGTLIRVAPASGPFTRARLGPVTAPRRP